MFKQAFTSDREWASEWVKVLIASAIYAKKSQCATKLYSNRNGFSSRLKCLRGLFHCRILTGRLFLVHVPVAIWQRLCDVSERVRKTVPNRWTSTVKHTSVIYPFVKQLWNMHLLSDCCFVLVVVYSQWNHWCLKTWSCDKTLLYWSMLSAWTIL